MIFGFAFVRVYAVVHFREMSVEFGEKLTLPESCFPRYQYFKNHLHSVVERLQRIVGKQKLAGEKLNIMTKFVSYLQSL